MTGTATFPDQIEQSIFARRLFRRGDCILVAVSGGLDSMVLLHVLAGLSARHRWKLTVAHFNHQLRGRSSDADEHLVQCTTKKLGVPFVAGRADVKKFARENKLSLEMAGRKLRHEFFAREAVRRKIRHVALAHHADDQVELFFLRLLRGSGGEGLAGMKWQSPSPANPKILLTRPLLGSTKADLGAYAKKNKIRFHEDATNSQLDFQRNRIRHELLPLLRKNYQPALDRVILRQMELLGAEADLVTQAATDWLLRGAREPAFNELPVAVQRRCLQSQLLEKGLPVSFDLVEELRATVNHPVCISPNRQCATRNKAFSITETITVQRDATGMLHIHTPIHPSFAEAHLQVRLQGKCGKICFETTQIDWETRAFTGTSHALAKCENCETFDAGKVGSDIVLRHWQPGDRFQPIAMPKAVKLHDLFINAKIPRAQRHELLVGAIASGEIFWVEGLRIGERYKLDKTTRYGLKWRWKRLSCL